MKMMMLKRIRENRRIGEISKAFRSGIPLSMPVTVIRELVEKFDVEPVLRPGKMDMTGEVMDREILVLRGDLETVKAVEKYMFEALDRKIAEWNSTDKERNIRSTMRSSPV